MGRVRGSARKQNTGFQLFPRKATVKPRLLQTLKQSDFKALPECNPRSWRKEAKTLHLAPLEPSSDGFRTWASPRPLPPEKVTFCFCLKTSPQASHQSPQDRSTEHMSLASQERPAGGWKEAASSSVALWAPRNGQQSPSP